MAARSTDLPVAYRGTPTPLPIVCTGVETWYAGSLIYSLVAGNATKTWAASLSFIGISPYNQVIAAGGTGLVYVGPYIAIFPEDTTAGVTIATEGDALGAIAAGDNYKDLVAYTTGTGADTASLVGRIVKVALPEV